MDNIEVALAEIKNDLKWIKERLEELKDDTQKRLDDHEQRIAKLEEFKYKTLGAILVVYAIISLIAAYILR